MVHAVQVLDHRLRPVKDRSLATLTRPLARHTGATVLTGAALVVTLAAAVAAATGHPYLALTGWLLGRVLDGLDGAVARARGEASDLGGYLDILADVVGYAAVPIGVALGVDQRGTWLALAVLLASFYVNAISWSYLAAVLEKRGAGASARGETTTITMPTGLVEGTETIVLFSLFLVLPQAATALFVIMAALVALTVLQRAHWAWSHL